MDLLSTWSPLREILLPRSPMIIVLGDALGSLTMTRHSDSDAVPPIMLAGT